MDRRRERVPVVVGVDLGATGIEAGAVRGGVVVARRSAGAPFRDGAEAVLGVAARLAGELAREHRARAIGVGSCGLIDAERGVVVAGTATTPEWEGTELAREMTARTGLACACDNDGNAAALGEARFGAGRGHRVVAVLTLGTGVGGGIVVDGRPLRGDGGMAGKLGHLLVRSGGRKCACEARGCLEAYASAWAMRRAAARRGRRGWDARDVFRAARAGDAVARALVDEAADAIGVAIGDIANAINPGVVAITGGIARGLPMMRARIDRAYRARALDAAYRTTRVVRSGLGGDAGMLGAAVVAERVLDHSYQSE